MKKIAVLGPKGTYSDIACREYLRQEQLNYEIQYYPSILKVSQAVDDDTYCILPFENTLDGFVMESMDRIISNKLHIISQTKLDIDFAFVSNAKDILDIKTCFVQFKTYGQCLDFISKQEFNTISTQSNSESLERLLEADSSFAAIVPVHMLEESKLSGNRFPIEILHVADSNLNQTRFFILSTKDESVELKAYTEASIVITSIHDRPGILFDILKEFHDLNINLNSIMSRPTKTEMGKYHFYIECGLAKDRIQDLDNLVHKLQSKKDFEVHILGIYNKL